jgi:glycosyltransferase involved in cell wall biosynthesis
VNSIGSACLQSLGVYETWGVCWGQHQTLKHLGLNLLFLLPDETGGRETYARELIRAMLETNPGFEITAFVNRESQARLRHDLGGAMRVTGIPVSPRRPDLWAAGELVLLPHASSLARVDVLHSMANFGPASGSFKRVLTLHDLQFRALPELMPRARRIATGTLLALGARRADRVIAVSAPMRDQIASWLPATRDRIDVISNGVGMPADVSASELLSFAQEHRIEDRAAVAVISSNFPHKNLAAVIDALALLGEDERPTVLFAGLGTDTGELGERVRTAGVESNVRLLGYCSRHAIEALYRTATCVVCPSLYEGFGLPVLEAMARGVPVACSEIPALREVTGGDAVHFAPTDPSAIADALRRLLSSPDLRQKLSAAGRTRADGFSWAQAASATLACYERAAGD